MKITPLPDDQMSPHLRGQARQFITSTGLSVIVTVDTAPEDRDGRIHMSAHHHHRAPTLSEIRKVIAEVMPAGHKFRFMFQGEGGAGFLLDNCVHVLEVFEDEMEEWSAILVENIEKLGK